MEGGQEKETVGLLSQAKGESEYEAKSSFDLAAFPNSEFSWRTPSESDVESRKCVRRRAEVLLCQSASTIYD